MKRILILANNDVGLYKFRKELIEELINPGSYIEGRKAKPCKVIVSLPDGEFVQELKKMGCEFINTPIDRRGVNAIEDLQLLSYYNKMVKEVKPNIVFCYTIKPNVYGGIVCEKHNIPYVSNITGLGTAVENKGILQLITVGLYRIALRKVQTVFFQNEENEKFFTDKKLCVGKHKMLPGSGVNLDYYKSLEYPSDETIEFVFIARIMKEKGIDQYLEAAKAIRMKYPNTRFHICGFCEQDYEQKIRELQREKVIIYHGLVDDMREIYEQVHCVVHPTYYPEGLSNVLLEASASARPIITTNRSGCREIIKDNENGFLTNEKDTNDLIKKIELFIKLPWYSKKEMGKCGRKIVEKGFNRKIIIESYCKEIN